MSSSDQYITPQSITKLYGVSSMTLRNWALNGKIKFIRPNEGRRLYNKDDVMRIFNQDHDSPQELINKKRLLYARVSSQHQVEDLNRQVEFLQSKYPHDQIIKDIGSGLNWKRKGLLTILELVSKEEVSEIIVAYKDRLCRFGFELFDWICHKHQTKIIVLNPVSETEDRTKELAEDLFSIVTVFVAKNNGLRSATNRQQRKSKNGTESSEDESVE
jgi:predicted site-specific integrase-resolvase